MTRPPLARMLLSACALALAVSACGDDGGTDEAPTTTSEAPVEAPGDGGSDDTVLDGEVPSPPAPPDSITPPPPPPDPPAEEG